MKKLTHKNKLSLQLLGEDWRRLSELFSEQYQEADQLLRQYVPRAHGARYNQFNLSGLINKGRDAINAIDPSAYFYLYQPLLAEKKAPRTIAVLMNVFYDVRMRLQVMQQWQGCFTIAYDEAHTIYYGNIADLMKLNDELKEYVRGKTLNKQAAGWVHGYFAIFDQWLRQGAEKEMGLLQQEIVLKIRALYRDQPGSPFGSKTNEKALDCIKAFDTMRQLEDTLLKKVQRYGAACKRAARITRLVSVGMLPAIVQPALHTGEATKTPVRKRWLLGVVLVLFAMICFWGGRYTVNRPNTTKAGVNVPVPVKKEIADTISGKPPAPVEPVKKVLPLDTVMTVCGLDISKYQGNLLKDLHQLDTMHFMICKATQGATLVDVDFVYNWQRLQQVKLVRGAYHFYMAKDDPVNQAQHFLRTVGSLSRNDIPLIIDIEEGSLSGTVNKKQLQSDLLTCLQYLHTRSGKKPVIYTDLFFANTYLQQPAFAAYPLWLAEYSRRPAPVLPQTWKEKGIVFWQKNDTLTVNSRKTDFDIFVGNGAAFMAFLTGEGEW